MKQSDPSHFNHIFWFCVGVFILSFTAMMALVFLKIPEINREMASNAQGFLQGTLISSAVGYLLTGSPPQTKPKLEPIVGTTTIDLSATTTTVEEPKQ